jgi:hypothetical protein
MIQVAAVADVTIPKIADAMRYDSNWDLDAYIIDKPQPRPEPGNHPEAQA